METISKRFDGKPPALAVDALDLTISPGEFLVLLGPSGCGKTTTLRCLAGLETPDAGRIVLGDTVVFDSEKRIDVPPDRRDIGMVFQSYALWPHMTVRRNIAYPLRARRLKHGLRDGWVESTAELVDCTSLLDRYPSQLSGGQQQRVALARGLVARPELVLFDEPLSNLDARLRDQVRAELHELHGRLGFSAVFVTHDQSEALALGDRIAIMRSGRIEQYGEPEDVFEQPATEYVAEFIGMSNRIECDYADGRWYANSSPLRGHPPSTANVPVVLRLRPDDVHVTARGDEVPDGRTAVDGTVVDTGYGGRHVDVVVELTDGRVRARVPTATGPHWARSLAAGVAVTLSFAPSAARSFDVPVADPS